MKRVLIVLGSTLLGLLALLNLVAGCWILPPLLLRAPLPARTEADRLRIRAENCPAGCAWTSEIVAGGEGRPLRVWRLHRPGARGVAVLLHGFGDDAWGVAPLAKDLPGLDAVVFTFRNRDFDPATAATLGAWEREDLVAVVVRLVAQGMPRDRILLVGASQGAGVALLALERLESDGGGPLGGALLESPFQNLREATRNHLRGSLGRAEWLLRPGERLALARAGRQAHFKAGEISPEAATLRLRTRIALLAGDADPITPLAGVLAIARVHPDLTIVPGAQHLEAGARIPGGWKAWAEVRLQRWGFQDPAWPQ